MFPELKYNPIRHKTALIVDDEYSILTLWRDLLMMHDCIAITRNCVKGAINYLLRHDVDFIISDYEMPEMNGFELIQWVRKDYDLFIPIILCTGSGFEELPPINDPFIKYIQKPFNIDDLIKSLSSIESILSVS